jgi:transcription-repair coupling factor (superfamily II helicase)
MQDRFGPIPQQVLALFDTVRCRRSAVEIGFERMMLKDDTLKCYFINRPDSPYFESELFQRVLDFIQSQTNQARLKQVGKLFMLVVDNIKDMKQLLRFLERMRNFVVAEVTNA